MTRIPRFSIVGLRPTNARICLWWMRAHSSRKRTRIRPGPSSRCRGEHPITSLINSKKGISDMDRREHLKLLLTGAMGAGMLASAACSPEEKKELDAIVSDYGRTPEERVVDEALHSKTIYTKRELAMV